MNVRDRHDSIVRSLRRNGTATVEELARQVRTSRRTVLRDICALRDQDISDMGRIDPDLLPAFETAFLQRLRLRFHYRDAKAAQTMRQVEPQAMLILPPLWYLVSWVPNRSDFRHFRMDRISQPEIIEDAPFRWRHVTFEGDVSPFSGNPR